MRQIYITIIAAAAALAVSGEAFARQDDAAGHERDERSDMRRGPGRGSGDPAMMIERLAGQLDLDETQRQAVANIVAASKPEFAALRDAARENREAIRALDVADPGYGTALQNLSVRSGELAAELTLLTGRLRGELAAILTDGQQQLLEDKMSRMGARHGQSGRDRAH